MSVIFETSPEIVTVFINVCAKQTLSRAARRPTEKSLL